jgi:micrococcal nuclease
MRWWLAAFLVLWLTVPIALAGPIPTIPGHVDRVIDGDTIHGTFTIWPEEVVTTSVRLRGIDAPEMSASCGPEREKAVAAKDALIRLIGGRPVYLQKVSTDKYGRALATVLTESGRDLSMDLINLGYAHVYDGRGPRAPWCP